MKTLKIFSSLLILALSFAACQKEYSIENNVSLTANGTWEFAEGANQYVGEVDTAYIDSSNAVKILNIVGPSKDGLQNFNLQLYATDFGPGEYKASAFQSSLKYSAGNTNIYQANQLAGEFIVIVTAYGNDMITGTFSGEAQDASGNLVQITAGKFTASLKTGNAVSTATGVLGDSLGFCAPIMVNGVYSPGVQVTSSHSMTISLVVAQTGTYTISSNTVNGITFSGTGTFTAAGAQTLVLPASGTSLASGNFDFVLSFGNSQCGFTVSVDQVGTQYVLGDSSGSCTPLNIGGTYEAGKMLDASNTIQIQVDVATVGSYIITTDTLNGISFNSSGTFNSTGVQNITLIGVGIPGAADTTLYRIIAATDTCTFALTVLPSSTPLGDYFPVTLNSFWSYSLVGGTTADSIKTTAISFMPVFAGNTYATFTTDLIPPSGIPDSGYYRKPGGDYYQYFNFSNYIPFDQAVDGEIIFLKDNVPAGTTWQSPNISGTVSGVPFAAYIKMTLLEKAVPATIGSLSFTDVIKVKYEYFIAGSPNVVETDERWFARDVGEIFFDFDDGVNKAAYEIGAYQVF